MSTTDTSNQSTPGDPLVPEIVEQLVLRDQGPIVFPHETPAPDTERDERLRGIQERVQAATEGPWRWANTTEPYLLAPTTRVVMAFSRMGMQGAQPQFRGDDGFLEDAGRANINDFPDARLIANAPEDMRYLLAEVARLDAVVTAAREVREEYFDEDGHTEPEDVWRLHRDLGRALDGGVA